MANLSFNDFIKIFTAYQQYVTAQAPTQPIVQAPQMTTPVAQPIVQAQAPQMTTPVAQPIVQAQAPYQEQYQALEQRLTAMENRAPMPTMETPAPVTVDDIIKGIIA